MAYYLLLRKEKNDGHQILAAEPSRHCEAEAVDLILELAKSTGVPTYIVHLSTLSGLKSIMEIREHGQKIYAETCPQYLCLTDELYIGENGIDYVMAPPLRKKKDCEALWKAIASGDIDTVGRTTVLSAGRTKSGTAKETCSGRPGDPGIETRMPILFSEGS